MEVTRLETVLKPEVWRQAQPPLWSAAEWRSGEAPFGRLLSPTIFANQKDERCDMGQRHRHPHHTWARDDRVPVHLSSHSLPETAQTGADKPFQGVVAQASSGTIGVNGVKGQQTMASAARRGRPATQQAKAPSLER